MILIGQYDSPFVRRVAIALRLYAMPFEHRPWSTFGDADKIAPFNPLRRVPTLVLEGGEALLESGVILDHLDELAGQERALIAKRGPQRRRALRVCALATGLADKAVSRSTRGRSTRRPRSPGSTAAGARSATCWMCSRGSAPRARRRAGSAPRSAMPTSLLPACCALPARPIR